MGHNFTTHMWACDFSREGRTSAAVDGRETASSAYEVGVKPEPRFRHWVFAFIGMSRTPCVNE